MKFPVYINIAIRIVILAVLGMILTYIPDHLRPFFGDTPAAKVNIFSSIDNNWDWGIRHYWYFWAVIALFILSAINFIMSIKTIVDKYYPSKY